MIDTPWRREKMARSLAPTDTAAINLIGEGSLVEGVMKSSTDVRVNGHITGELNVEGKVIVAEKGVIDGTLVAQNADVAGTVLGNLRVSERLVLRPTAKIEGNVFTARLVVEEGAVLDGMCDMGRLEEVRRQRMGDGQSLLSTAEFVFEAVEHQVD